MLCPKRNFCRISTDPLGRGENWGRAAGHTMRLRCRHALGLLIATLSLNALSTGARSISPTLRATRLPQRVRSPGGSARPGSRLKEAGTVARRARVARAPSVLKSKRVLARHVRATGDDEAHACKICLTDMRISWSDAGHR